MPRPTAPFRRITGIVTAPVTRAFALTVACLEFAAGVSGLILGGSHFSGPTYQPARQLFTFLPGEPFLWWSWLLVLLAVAAIAVTVTHADELARSCFAVLCGFWAFWSFIYFAAYGQPTSGPWAPWVALIALVGNARPVIARSLADG